VFLRAGIVPANGVPLKPTHVALMAVTVMHNTMSVFAETSSTTGNCICHLLSRCKGVHCWIRK